jgi:hypothetical protein
VLEFLLFSFQRTLSGVRRYLTVVGLFPSYRKDQEIKVHVETYISQPYY